MPTNKKEFLRISSVQFIETKLIASWNNNFHLISVKKAISRKQSYTHIKEKTKTLWYFNRLIIKCIAFTKGNDES